MGNLYSGIVLLLATIGMVFWFKPKSKDSLKICGVGLFMGLLSIMMSDGITGLQIVEHLMQAFVLGCCFIQLRQEKKQRAARKTSRKIPIRQVQPNEKGKTRKICA